jgi:hypothetical protein
VLWRFGQTSTCAASDLTGRRRLDIETVRRLKDNPGAFSEFPRDIISWKDTLSHDSWSKRESVSNGGVTIKQWARAGRCPAAPELARERLRCCPLG